MSTYVVGDIQGCYQELTSLLETTGFKAGQDSLWLLGDLINRGPENCEVMELVMSLENVICVLGNHDLHFLAVARGHQPISRSDTFNDMLESPRLPGYIEYLRNQPMLHYCPDRDTIMVHAGLPPQLSLPRCLELAHEVENVLRSSDMDVLLSGMYGNEPAVWNENLTGADRLRVITNGFTRLRYCRANGEMELTHKADIQPQGYQPWFSFPREDSTRILFGHWAALNGEAFADHVVALDTGCVWGRELTAMRLEDGHFFSVPARRVE